MAKPFPRRLLEISIMVLVLSCVVMAGEPVWLGLIWIWTIVLTLRWMKRWFAFVPLAAAAAILIAHGNGYKLYGRPIVRDNRPLLEKPMRLVRLEAPNFVVNEQGDRFPLKGVRFMPDVGEVTTEDLERTFSDGLGGPILFKASDSEPSGFVAERHCAYFCGNTFFPHALASPLPKYRLRDLGKCLCFNGLAEEPKPF
jgi:hypothetical protein